MTAGKPFVLHPGLSPLVMSWNALGFAYRNGFRKPSDGRPAERRALLRRLMKPAKVGAAADVPPMRPDSPPTKILKRSA